MDTLRKPPSDFLDSADAPGSGAASTADAPPVRVWLVDDNDIFRGLLAEGLQRQEGIECRRHFPCAQSALRALAYEPPPDVVLLDVNLRGASGLDAVAPLKAAAGTARVMMLTTFFDHRAEMAARRAGAVGFLLKSCSCDQLARFIRAAHEVEPLTVSVSVEAGRRAASAPHPALWLERGTQRIRTWIRSPPLVAPAAPSAN